MENLIEIINNRLDEQSLLGKEYLSINEIKNILEQVNDLVSQSEIIEANKTKRYNVIKKQSSDVFNDIMSKISGTKKDDRYPNYLFYMIGDIVYMERDLETNIFYIRYDNFWTFFQFNLNMMHQDIQEMLRVLLEEYFNCEVKKVHYSWCNTIM